MNVLLRYLLNEVADTLREPGGEGRSAGSPQQIEAFVRVLLKVAHAVRGGTYEVRLVSRDVDDNPVVGCALEGGARFVVTGD